MRGGAAVCVVVLACACGSEAPLIKDAPESAIDAPPGVDPNDGARSGTRLKLTWFDFTDGTRQWDGFYDAERKETCYVYQNWIDGKSYCAPDYYGSIVYSNATCTTKVAELYKDPSCAPVALPYVMDWEYTPCDSRPAHLYVRGNKLALAQVYYRSSTGACQGPYSTTADYDYYAVGAEVAPSELVEVTLGSPTGPGRLGARFWQSPDGMRRQATVHDAALGTDCYPQVYATGATTGSCGPQARYAAYDQDSSCTQHKLALDKQCALPKYTVYYSPNACPADPPSYYTLGALTSGSPLYYNNGSACVEATPQASNNYYRVGTELAVAPVTREIAAAQSRLQLVHFTNSEGLSYRSYELYDAQKEADCYPTKLPDGTIRCVVYGGYVRTLYRESTCTQTIDLVEVETGPASCGAPAVPKFARKYITPAAGSCQYGTQVYSVGAQYPGAVYENFGTCQPYAPVNARLYSLGAAVPLSDFVSATTSIDP